MDHRQDDSAPTVDAPNSDGLVPDFSNKVVPLRPWTPPKAQERLDPRLEELRRILAQAKPVAGEHSDDEVIRDEDRFRRRFGPGFRWNRRDRIGLIALKKRYDLTDPEIKLFQHTGNLRRTPFGVILTASPTPNWRLRLAATSADGKNLTDKKYPLLWNDQFHVRGGTVTYQNGTPVTLPVTPTVMAAPKDIRLKPGACPCAPP